MFSYKQWKMWRAKERDGFVNLDGRNDWLEEVENINLWEALDFKAEMKAELDLDDWWFCKDDYCSGYSRVHVLYCHECGGPVEKLEDE